MTFLVYGVVSADSEGMDGSDQMDLAEELGFDTARCVVDGLPYKVVGAAAVQEAVNMIELARPGLGMDIDGAVIKLNNSVLRAEAGDGSHTPRWAIARKYPPDTRQTELLAIDMGVGRTGNLSFTARVRPVLVNGSTISNISVHNVEHIARLGLCLPSCAEIAPQSIWIYKAGEVIPQITHADPPDTPGLVPWEPPVRCPNGHELDKSSKVWRCVEGRRCQLEANICYAVSRDAGLDIDGMGVSTVHSLVLSGRVNSVADLFSLERGDLVEFGGMGDKNAEKVAERIEQARGAPLNKVFCSLGVSAAGRRLSKMLAVHFGTLSALRSATIEQLCEVEAVGRDRAMTIRSELDGLAPVLDQLEEMGIGSSELDIGVDSDAPFIGKSVVVTGSVPGMSRLEAQEAVERLGGRAASSISAKTSLVVIGDGAGMAKLAAIEKHGIDTLAAADFAKLAAGLS